MGGGGDWRGGGEGGINPRIFGQRRTVDRRQGAQNYPYTSCGTSTIQASSAITLTAGGSAFTFDLLTFLILIRLFLVTTKRRSI